MVLPTMPQESSGLPPIASTASAAEEMGFGSVWVTDHLYWQSPVMECFTAATLAVSATKRCSVGTAVLQLPLRSPAVVSKTASSLQWLSGGRFVLGLGVGAHEGEYEAAGVEFHSRGHRMDDQLQALRSDWSEAPESRYAQRPFMGETPLWFGGADEAVLNRAASIGSGWIPLFLAPHILKEQYVRLDEKTRAAGRAETEVEKAVMCFVSVATGAKAASAREDGCEWLSKLYALPANKFGKHLIAGSPDECVDSLAQYVQAGAEHIVMHFTSDNPIVEAELLYEKLESEIRL